MKLLISPGYGAGWSTWNLPAMATDKDLIELFERGCTCEEMEKLCIEKNYIDAYYEPPCMRGFQQLKVIEIPKGALYRINVYDGAESVEIFNPDKWLVAE